MTSDRPAALTAAQIQANYRRRRSAAHARLLNASVLTPDRYRLWVAVNEDSGHAAVYFQLRGLPGIRKLAGPKLVAELLTLLD